MYSWIFLSKFHFRIFCLKLFISLYWEEISTTQNTVLKLTTSVKKGMCQNFGRWWVSRAGHNNPNCWRAWGVAASQRVPWDRGSPHSTSHSSLRPDALSHPCWPCGSLYTKPTSLIDNSSFTSFQSLLWIIVWNYTFLPNNTRQQNKKVSLWVCLCLTMYLFVIAFCNL